MKGVIGRTQIALMEEIDKAIQAGCEFYIPTRGFRRRTGELLVKNGIAHRFDTASTAKSSHQKYGYSLTRHGIDLLKAIRESEHEIEYG